MQRRPPLAFAIALALTAAGCTPKPNPDDGDEPVIEQLSAAAAAESFFEKIESRLDVLHLADAASSALVKSTPGDDTVEIAYVFSGRGGPLTVEPILQKLANKWPTSPDRECWIPWEKLIDAERIRPGAFMGAYRSEDFQLTLWIDQFANDFFICYREPAPALPAPEADPSPDPSPEHGSE